MVRTEDHFEEIEHQWLPLRFGLVLDREGARRRNHRKISLFIPDAVRCCLVLLVIMGMHLLLQNFLEERIRNVF